MRSPPLTASGCPLLLSIPFYPQIVCQEHWTGWQDASPFKLPNGRGGACSATCTRQGTLQLMRETGAVGRAC